MTFWSVILIDDQSLNRRKLFGEHRPDPVDAVGDGVACHRVGNQKDVDLVMLRQEYANGGHFFVGTGIVVKGFDLNSIETASG